MAGNSRRKGAVRRSSKGNPTAGSGGRVRRGLEGKGPTPKARDRPGHKSYQGTQGGTQGGKQGGKQGGRQGQRSGQQGGRPRQRGSSDEWVAGRNAVVELLRAGAPATALYVVEGTERDGRLREAFALAADRGVPLLEVGRGELDRLTGGAVHQGLAARVPAYHYAHPDDLLARAEERGEPPLVVALDSVTDPRNLGAVIRSAAAFGAHGVLVPERRAAGVTAAAWKASVGAATRVPVAQAVNLVRQLKAYQAAGCMVVGLAADGDVSLPDLDLADSPLVVVVGSEGGGLGRLVRETCDQRVRVPMAAEVESLNAGVAASVVLYAVSQARR